MESSQAKLSFRHSGKLGDIIYSLPTVRVLGGGAFYVRATGYELNASTAASILPLLRGQSYIASAELWDAQSFDVDLDVFRYNQPLRKNLADAHLTAFGLQPSFRDQPWLTLPERNGGETSCFDIILSRSLVRSGPPGFWELVCSLVGEHAAFVGSPAEHKDFCSRYGNVRYKHTEDLLELAYLIRSATLFIGNQSCPYAIAEGLKVPSILEVDPAQPNCLFGRQSVLSIIRPEDLARVESFIKKNVPALPPPSRHLFDLPSPDSEAQERLSVLARIPPSTNRVLQIGCDGGQMGEFLGRVPGRHEIWGIEGNIERARRASERLDKVLVGDIERMSPLPLPFNFFDCVLWGELLPTLRHPEMVLCRLQPHLTEDAVLLCSIPNPSHSSAIARLLAGESIHEDAVAECRGMRSYTSRSFARLVWDAGYVVHGEIALYKRDSFCDKLQQAAPVLGLDARAIAERSAIYKTIVEFRTQPNPFKDPKKWRALLGPHQGAMGPATKRASIIIVTFNSEKCITACLESLLPTLTVNDEVLVIDNASIDRTPEVLSSYTDAHHSINVILNGNNIGFSAGCNIGMLQSKGEFIVLLNPDTLVGPNWIEGLIAGFQDERVAATGPVTDRACGEQYTYQEFPDVGVSPVDASTGRRQADTPTYRDTNLLIGFCMAISRRVLDDVGLLEEELFLGSDDFELSWRLRRLGYTLRIMENVFVHHDMPPPKGSKEDIFRTKLSVASAGAFEKKLRAFYGGEAQLSSELLWGRSVYHVDSL